MILVDTAIWIDYFRGGDAALTALLEEDQVLIHPLVIEELACGNLSPRASTLDHLHRLPRPPVASHSEVLALIENENLFARGIGALDAHLIASARLAHAQLWTRDKALAVAATRLGLAA